MNARGITTIGALMLAIGGACRGQAGDTPDATPLATPKATGVPLGAQQLRMLDQGDAPRRSLRWDLAEGQREHHSSVIIIATRTVVDDQAFDLGEDPAQIIDGELTVREIASDGEITIGFAFEGDLEGIDGGGNARGAGGASGFYRMDPRGRVLEIGFDATGTRGPGARAMLEQHVRRTQLMLPIQEVGIGARWSVSSECLIAGIRYDQTITYTLDAMEGDAIGLVVESKVLSNEARDMDLPGLPAEARAKIRSTLQKTTGRQEIRLDRIGPVMVSNESEIVQVIRVVEGTDGGDAYDVVTHVTGVLAARSAPAEVASEPVLANVIDDDE